MFKLTGKVTWLYWSDFSIEDILKSGNKRNEFKTEKGALQQLNRLKKRIEGNGYVTEYEIVTA